MQRLHPQFSLIFLTRNVLAFFFFFPWPSWIIMLGSGTWFPLLKFLFFWLCKYYIPLYCESVLCPAWPSLSVPVALISTIFDEGGHSFPWLSALVNVPDWFQNHCRDRKMSVMGDFHSTVTRRPALQAEQGERMSNYPVDVIHADSQSG